MLRSDIRRRPTYKEPIIGHPDVIIDVYCPLLVLVYVRHDSETTTCIVSVTALPGRYTPHHKP